MSQVTTKPASGVTTQEAAPASRPQPTLHPAADIFEGADGITLLLDMPGVSKERLNLNVDGNQLVVEGDVQIDMPEGMESRYADVHATHYRRSFSLSGEQLDTDAVEAALDNGVLRIHIPKRQELRPRKIEVTVG